MNGTEWPVGIYISEESGAKLDELKKGSNSPFSDMTMVDILIISAAIALKNGVRPLRENTSNKRNITHQRLVNSEIQSFMCMLYYSLPEGGDIDCLKDKRQVTKIFEQYAQAGLAYLYELSTRPDFLQIAQDEIRKSMSSRQIDGDMI